MTEKEVVKELRRYWKQNGWYVIRNQQNIGSHKGLADFLVIKNGLHVFVEAKGERGRQSDVQRIFENDIKNFGGYYVVCKSAEDFDKYVRCL